MDKSYILSRNTHKKMRKMSLLTVCAAAVTPVLRTVLSVWWQDTKTGQSVLDWIPVAFLLAVLAVLVYWVWKLRVPRCELTGPRGTMVGIALLLAGGCLLLVSLWDGIRWLVGGIIPPPTSAEESVFTWISLSLSLLFGVWGGGALLHWGQLLLAEKTTRPGMLSWSALAPVLWMWFRLMRYEMSYSSALGLVETFYDFGMFILQLLFLFKLARYASGIGDDSSSSLLLHACAAAVFCLSAPLTRLGIHLLGKSSPYEVTRLAGLSDFAVGVLALVVVIAMVRENRTLVVYRCSRPIIQLEELGGEDINQL